MLPEELHIKEINRFHKKMNEVKQQFEDGDERQKRELSLKYFALSEIWGKIDEFIEFTLKHELDCIENIKEDIDL